MNKKLMRVEEAARLLCVSRWTIYRWIEDGRLCGARIGKGSLRVFSESVTALVEETVIDKSFKQTDPGAALTAEP